MRIKKGRTYKVSLKGDTEPMLYGVVFRVNEPDELGQAVFLNCTKTGDEWVLGTEEVDFLEVDSITLKEVCQ